MYVCTYVCMYVCMYLPEGDHTSSQGDSAASPVDSGRAECVCACMHA